MAPHKITGLNQLREMQMGDWLHYASTPLPKERFTYLRDAVVMITGGGGTVGSELCRQVAVQSPRALIVLDRDELALRHTCVTLRSRHPHLDIIQIVADVRDLRRIWRVI